LSLRFTLHQNYPNPFNAGTTIKFEVPENMPGRKKVQLIIYNSLGQEICRLYDGPTEGGVSEIYWDAGDDCGDPVSTGFYFIRLKANNYVRTIKSVLMR
jgi:hypothetical protein